MANRSPAEDEWVDSPQPTSNEWVDAPEGLSSDSVFVDKNKELDVKGRTYVKNLGTDMQSQLSVIKRLNPDMDVALSPDNEIQVKKKGEDQWSPMDLPASQSIGKLFSNIGQAAKNAFSPEPPNLNFSQEPWKDIKDVGFDVAASIPQAALTTAAGLAGGLPGAMLGSGVAGAGTEAARQKLAEFIGNVDSDYAQNLDPSQIVMAGGAGALAPLVLGTGATSNQVMNQAASNIARRGVKAESPEFQNLLVQEGQNLLNKQKGLVGKGIAVAQKTILPKLGSALTGENQEVIKWAADNIQKIRDMEKNPEMFAYKMEQTSKAIRDKLKQRENAYFDQAHQIHGILDNEGVTINTEAASKPIQDLKEKYSGLWARNHNPNDKAQLDLINQLENEYLHSGQNQLHFDPSTGQIGIKQGFGYQNMSVSDAFERAKNLNDLAQKTGMDFKNTARTSGPQREATTAMSGDISAAFGKTAANLKEGIKQGAEQFFQNKPGTDQWKNLRSQYSEAMKGYGSIQDIQKALDPKLKDASSVSNFLRKSRTDMELGGLVNSIKNETGIDVIDLAKERRAYKIFARPEDKRLSYKPEDLGSGGRKNLSRAAYSAGLLGSSLLGGGLPGMAGLAGAGLAETALHPWTYRRGIGALDTLGRGMSAPGVAQGAQFLQRQNIPKWHLLDEENQNGQRIPKKSKKPEDYEIKQWADHIHQAEMVKSDPEKMKHVMPHLKKMMKAHAGIKGVISSMGELRKKASSKREELAGYSDDEDMMEDKKEE